ncbi:hypothetical protein N0V90_012160 [Kalmusia sp. IMI 367209]|nr:hypothetical protein N0V90_012160 [Kalmusia sp. IMI 367209]
MRISLFSVVCLYSLTKYAHAYRAKPSNGTNGLKIIIDTDFNTIGDDGQVLAMAAQLHAAGTLDLLGLTVVAGNQYLNQEVSDALKAVERLGIERTIGVYEGADVPLLHDYAAYQLEQQLFGNATEYVAAYTQPETQDLIAPPDGFATHTVPARKHAVQFLVDTIHRFPHEVTLLAVGPLTNIALAMRLDPTIIPLIKSIVIMGGQAYVEGNAYNGAGETNWWFDAEAARIVLRAPGVKRKIIGLDVTNTAIISNATYDAVGNHEPATPITTLFRDIERWPYVYDTVALASLYNESLDLDVRQLYVDVSAEFNAEYGKGLVWETDPYPGIPMESMSDVVFKIDNDRFFELYVDLLTRPVPVAAY